MRRSALRQLIQLRGPKLQGLLIKTASTSGDYVLQQAALKALSKERTPEARRAMLKLFETSDRTVRDTLMPYLAKMGGSEVREVLIKRLRENTYNHNLRFALGSMRDPESRRRMRALLDDPTLGANAKSNLVYTLAAQRDTAGLLAAASHSDKNVRQSALQQLGRLGGANAEQTLIDAAADPAIKRAALKGLAHLGTSRAINALGQALHDKKNINLVAAALAQHGSKQALTMLQNHLRSADDATRLVLVNHVGGAQHSPQASALLVEALDDNSAEVASTAAVMLARYRGSSYYPRVLSLMQSGPPRVRYAVAKQLRWWAPRLYKEHKALIDEIYKQGG